MKIIDTEVHLLHPEAQNRKFARFDREPTVQVIHKHIDFPKIEHKLSLQALKASIHRNHISKAIIMGMPWRDRAIQNDNNSYIEECVINNPEMFRAMFIPNLSNCRKALADVESFNTSCFLGVKLLTRDQGRKILDPELYPIYQTIIDRKLILMLHIDHMTQNSDGDTAFDLLQLKLRFPKLKIVAAHLGGLLCIYGLAQKYRKIIKQIHFITSVSSTLKMVELAAKVNASNIMFGTDFPFNHSHSQAQVINGIKKISLSKTELAAIFYNNARKFYGIK